MKSKNETVRQRVARTIPKREWRFPLVAFLLPVVIYSATLAPTVTLEDSAEYIAVARVLGLAHPPGNPTWTVLGYLFACFPLGNVAMRTNFLSVVCGGGASLFLFLWLRQFRMNEVLSLSCALTAAFSRCIWGQSVVTEVYSMTLLVIFLCFYLTGKWRETADPRWLWATALIGGLGAGVHHLVILLSPIIVVWAIWGRWAAVLKPKTAIVAILSLLLGFSNYLYLPMRSSSPIAWEKVDSLSSFVSYFTREIYKTAEGGVWTQGTKADALSFLAAFFKNLPLEVGGILVLFAIPGWVGLWRTRRGLCLLLSAMIVMNVPVLLLLAGTAVFTPTSEFINQLYYLPAVAAVAVFVAFGWYRTWEFLFHRLRGSTSSAPMFFLLLTVPIITLIWNWKACDRSEYWVADEYARNLLRNLEPGDAVFPITNNESFLLLYFNHVAEDRRAFLLDDRFGWNPKDLPGRVYTAWDVGKSSNRPIEHVFGNKETVPETLLYRVFNQPAGEGLSACRWMRPLRLRIHLGPENWPRLSPFERMIFASYSAYYGRLGGAYWLAGEAKSAKENWAKSEELNPSDAYCHYLLGTLYEEAGIEGANAHFRKSEEVFPLSFDPLDTRFYSVSWEEILAKTRR